MITRNRHEIKSHNPRCSKSRQALALLENRGASVTTRRYLDDAPSLAELRAELDAWMKQQDNAQTLFGQPLLRGEPVTIVVPAVAPKKKSP